MAEGHIVEGRQFRTKTDYEAALRDKKKIDKIRSEYDLQNPKAVLELAAKMKAGDYRFETMVGNDFDDKIFELSEKYKNGGSGEKGRGKAGRGGKDRMKGKKNQKRESGPGKESSTVSLDDLDEDMRREVAARLKARDRRRKLLVTLCAAGAVLCFGYFVVYYYRAEKADSDYEQLADLKNSDALSETKNEPLVLRGHEEEMELPDVLDEYKTLYNKNRRLIGWLKIDDTIIDYPVMQTANNEYYLDHNFNQEYDKNGSLFLDKDCDVVRRNTNLIIYGHHMKSGKMFGNLNSYSNEEYGKKHSLIQFDTIYEKGTYEVMYVFRSRIYNEDEVVFKYYQFLDAASETEFNSNMQEMAALSLYDTGVTASYGDELLTLSTCDSSETDGRFVVVAKRVS